MLNKILIQSLNIFSYYKRCLEWNFKAGKGKKKVRKTADKDIEKK